MARWIPPSDRIDRNEHIGRRLFDEPMLVGAVDQRSFAGLLLSHFEETRDDEISVDRLGRSSVDSRVVNFLRPLGEAAAAAFRSRKRFDGWVVLPAHRLTAAVREVALPLKASPEPDNPYHAHVDTQSLFAAEPSRHYFIALHLRYLFTGPGSSVHRAIVRTRPGFLWKVFSALWEWFSKRWKR